MLVPLINQHSSPIKSNKHSKVTDTVGKTVGGVSDLNPRATLLCRASANTSQVTDTVGKVRLSRNLLDPCEVSNADR